MKTKTIRKYPVGLGLFQLALPQGAQFLCTAEQHGGVQSWWLVDPECAEETRSFVVRTTGEMFSGRYPERHLGTFFLHGGLFVGHLFEILEREETK